MRKVIALSVAMMLMATLAFSQAHEAGLSLGASNFMGDLGKRMPKGNTYFSNITASLFRPAGAVFYRYNFNKRISLRANVSYGSLEGNDALVESKEKGSDGWFRYNRNLHFKTHIIEASVVAEVNILPYEPGSKIDRMTPYVFGGVGLFYFNPKAVYKGEWVELQPLGTEGQGSEQYPDREKYSLIQPSIPLGIGFKYNINHKLSIGIEFGHRFTFTDYIDDVSKTYPEKEVFDEQYDGEKAEMAKELSNRSDEINTDGEHSEITGPGKQRGNPDVNDQYLFSMISLSYNFPKQKSRFTIPKRFNR